jgi:hypothetical protein
MAPRGSFFDQAVSQARSRHAVRTPNVFNISGACVRRSSSVGWQPGDSIQWISPTMASSSSATSFVPLINGIPRRKNVSFTASLPGPNAATWIGLVTNARASVAAASSIRSSPR